MTNKFITKKSITENSKGQIDKTFLLAVILLALYGTLMVFSAGGPYAAARRNVLSICPLLFSVIDFFVINLFVITD